MEGKTPTEKVHELSNLVATVREQINSLDSDIRNLVGEHSRTAQVLGDVKVTLGRLDEQLSELQRWKREVGALSDFKTEIVVLKRNVEKLEQTKEEWSRRIWAMAGPILGAVVGWFLASWSHR